MNPRPIVLRRPGRASRLGPVLALLALGCAPVAADHNGAYRFDDGRLVLIAQSTGEGLSASELTTGDAFALQPARGESFDVVPRGAEKPSGAASFERAADGTIAALRLNGDRGERLALPELPLEIHAPDGTRLAARLVLPAGAGPHPAVVYVHGSGRQSATRTFPYGYLLAAHGVATLVYDKRGTGGSGGDFTFDFETLARDTAAVVEALRRRPEVDPGRIGLIGYSQGGWVAPLAASKTRVAFVVLNYGMIESPAEEERQETLWRLRERGLSETELVEADALIRASIPVLASDFERGWEAWDRAARAARGRPWTRKLDETTIGALLSYPRWLVKILGPRRAPPEMPWSYDGRAVLEASDTPMVWLLGAEDRSAPNARTLEILEELARSGRRQAVFLFEGADHGIVLFQRAGGERTATRFHPEYLRTKVRVVQELAAGRWPPAGAGRVPLAGGER